MESNQPEFGSTQPKCATQKRSWKVKSQMFFVLFVLIFLGQQSVLPDISLYVSNKNNLNSFQQFH